MKLKAFKKRSIWQASVRPKMLNNRKGKGQKKFFFCHAEDSSKTEGLISVDELRKPTHNLGE